MVLDINPKYPARNNTPVLNIDGISKLLQKHSISCTWEQSFECPCIDPQTNAPNPLCPTCHGQGRFFNEPKLIDIAMTSDTAKDFMGSEGVFSLTGTIATPQLTSNGIENGIKIGDRITVDNWDTTQTYLFNVNQQRLDHGLFIPYNVRKIDKMYTIDDSGNLVTLSDKDITIDSNSLLTISNRDLLGKSISLSLSVIKRFYVVSLLKELRYQKFWRYVDKRCATGWNNPVLSFPQPKPNNFVTGDDINESINGAEPTFPLGDQVFKLPNKLLLRRETMFFSNRNLAVNEGDNNTAIDTKQFDEINDMFGGY